MNPRGHLIDPAYCGEQLARPEYAALNEDLGLPPQSVVLKGLVEQFGAEGTRQKIDEIMHDAPFLLFDNFFLANLDFFVANWKKTKALSLKIKAFAKALFSDLSIPDAIYIVTHELSYFSHNKKVQAGSDLFAMIESVLDAFPCDLKITPDEFRQMVYVMMCCKTAEQFRAVSSALKTGEARSATDLWKAAPVDVARTRDIGTVGLKITNGCKRQCTFCFEKAQPNLAQAQTLTLDDFSEMESTLNQAMSVNLNGGECTEHPDFFAICDYLETRGIIFGISTTGATPDQLEQLARYYKTGAAYSLTLSVHNFYSERVRAMSTQTAACLVQHNIPFTINFPIADFRNPQEAAPIVSDLFALLNANHVAGGIGQGRTMNMFHTTRKFKRDPLVSLRIVPAFPGGKHIDDQRAKSNAQLIAIGTKRQTGSTASFCTAGEYAVHPDKTVSPCCCALTSHGSVPNVLDHLPASGDELLTAMERYRTKLQDVYDKADRLGILPCFVHRTY